jgi:hypothetical protein
MTVPLGRGQEAQPERPDHSTAVTWTWTWTPQKDEFSQLLVESVQVVLEKQRSKRIHKKRTEDPIYTTQLPPLGLFYHLDAWTFGRLDGYAALCFFLGHHCRANHQALFSTATLSLQERRSLPNGNYQ